MTALDTIKEMDRATVLHPFTHAKDFAAGVGDCYVVETGSGVRIRGADGSQLIDGFGGLYCVNVGYGRSEVAEAISEQVHKLAYFHSYAGHTTEALATLSDRLVKMAPGRMSKVFYGLSGSDANETQAKLVWYYNNLRGKPKKKKILSRERGYHGCSVISGSMTGMSFYHDYMDLPLPIVRHAGVPHHYWGAHKGESEEAFSKRRAAELDAQIEAEGPDTVGAFIAEPVLGTGGLTPPSAGYWDAIQPVLKKHDVLLIADEVICGFGRIGTPFGSHRFNIEPDLVTCAKGLTSAYVPMSAAIIGERVWEVVRDGADKVGAFSHGYTYSGHPLGAAAANVCLDIVEREDLAGNAERVGGYLLEQLRKAVGDYELVGEVRGIGMLAAVEFVADRQAKRRFDPALKVGARLSAEARRRGLITRAMPHGDILGFAPPLVLTPGDADEIVAIVKASVDTVVDQLTRENAL
ncbi:aminotransferase [Sphingosinicella microcystinivorans]|uniref:Aminotransferase y4uB n=1 Tax=Sphingosinicella microcystinivorans TaxID=335406 RepID=A0AAD1D8M0_SPHMI|nr:aminotransferase [Sphingosinicella microcystinivorans]RKS86341.1 L-2,4-diaminobutyrate transaminase [Sphingosinicella microcystinivorans]BBE35614.1 putative aminotransferase y4uB [Sphingosinicella microcystinivorans]